MRVTVVTRDGVETEHRGEDVHLHFLDDRVEVMEAHQGPGGTSWMRSTYLRESIARIVEHDYMPDQEGEGDGEH